MTLDIFNSRMVVSSGVLVVHEPHGKSKATTVSVVVLPMLICAWWRVGGTPMMDGIVSQSFQ